MSASHVDPLVSPYPSLSSSTPSASAPAPDSDRAALLKAFDESRTGVRSLVESGVSAVPDHFVHPNPYASVPLAPPSVSIPVVKLSLPAPLAASTVTAADEPVKAKPDSSEATCAASAASTVTAADEPVKADPHSSEATSAPRSTRDHPFSNPFGPESPAMDNLVLPPMLVVVAEYDLLSDRAADYAARLKAMGKSVELVKFEGQDHWFFSVEPYGDTGSEVVRLIKQFVYDNGGVAAAST